MDLLYAIIITILLGCYIIFSKNSTNKTVNNSQKNDGTSDNVSNVVNSEYNYNLTKRTTTQAVKESTYKMKVTVDTEGNVYLDCNDSVINDVKNENIKKNLTNLRSKYDVYFPSFNSCEIYSLSYLDKLLISIALIEFKMSVIRKF